MDSKKMNAKIAKKKVKLGSQTKNNKKAGPKIIPHPAGSYNPQYVYLVHSSTFEKWEDAKILEIELLKKHEGKSKLELTPEHYRYYIHYFNFNRFDYRVGFG